MACPSGCLNGGAQCRGPEASVNPKEIVTNLEEAYKDLKKEWPSENKEVGVAYNQWLGGVATDKADHLLYTNYHEVEKMTNSLAIKW